MICRSTTGTGTSARLAFLHYENRIKQGDKLETVSLRDTRFIGIFDSVEKVQGYNVINNRICGKSYILGKNDIYVNSDDPMATSCSELLHILQ